MKIAICDDEPKDLQQTAAWVQDYLPDAEIVKFSAARDLLSAFDETFYSLVFLDILMPEPNGFYAAEQLMKLDQKPLIIFTTQSTEYSIRGYDVAFHYLVKPLNLEKLHQVIDRALKQLQSEIFTFSSKNTFYQVPIAEILYFESKNYHVLVHTNDMIYETRLSLKDLEAQLSVFHFCRSHASFLVNLNQVAKVNQLKLVLKNNEILPVSRNRKKNLDNRLQNYIRRTI